MDSGIVRGKGRIGTGLGWDKTLDKPFFLLAKLGTWDERDIALGIALSCYCTVGYRDFP